jgi:NB-ARC domain
MTQSKLETFTQAASAWNLETLYADLAIAKEQTLLSKSKNKGLTEIEKLHLRGLLCGNSPATIAAKLYKKAQGVEVDLCKTIYRYVKKTTGHTNELIDNWRTIIDWLAIAGYQLQKDDVVASKMSPIDWGNAPSATDFYGRTTELATLQQWIVNDRCRLVGLLGMGGIGKTALAIQLIEKIHQEFDYVVWRSIAPLPDISQPLVQILPGEETQDLPTCLDYLRSHRCLIVLDAFETILNPSAPIAKALASTVNYSIASLKNDIKAVCS